MISNAAAQAAREAGVAVAKARAMTDFLDRSEAPCYEADFSNASVDVPW